MGCFKKNNKTMQFCANKFKLKLLGPLKRKAQFLFQEIEGDFQISIFVEFQMAFPHISCMFLYVQLHLIYFVSVSLQILFEWITYKEGDWLPLIHSRILHIRREIDRGRRAINFDVRRSVFDWSETGFWSVDVDWPENRYRSMSTRNHVFIRKLI